MINGGPQWWEGGYRKLQLTLGPDPPAVDRAGGTETGCAPTTSHPDLEYPSVYEDLVAVFSEEECEVLPPHRSTDCAIELIPGPSCRNQ